MLRFKAYLHNKAVGQLNYFISMFSIPGQPAGSIG